MAPACCVRARCSCCSELYGFSFSGVPQILCQSSSHQKKEVPPVAYGTSHGVHATITLCAPHKTQQREVNHHPAHPNVHPAQKLRCPMCLAAGGNFRKLSGHPLASHCTRPAAPQQLQLYYKLYEGLIRPAQRCHIHACNDVYHV